jgi:hypothetical protein
MAWSSKSSRARKQGGEAKVIGRNTVEDLLLWFGLPEERFASKSMRIGFASGSNHLNVDEKLVRERGGWSKNSNVPKKHYTKGVETGGLLAWSSEGQLRAEDVRKIV